MVYSPQRWKLADSASFGIVNRSGLPTSPDLLEAGLEAMTTRQKIEVRLSKVRERLNAIAGLEGDEFTDEVQTELGTLEGEYSTLEKRLRAAILSEPEEEAAIIGQFPDGSTDQEGAELRSLLGRVTLADYLGPASAGAGISGAAAELNAALELPAAGASGGVSVPWRVLETRAFSTTSENDGPESQRSILQRLFGPGIMDTLGVRLDAVPVGRTEWPLITSGVAPAQTKEPDAAAAAVAAGFEFANLKPKRITGRYEFTHEMAASVPGIEAALRQDLADAVRSKMSDLILNGAAPTNAAPQNIQGLITKLTGEDLSAAVATAHDYGRLHALAVDGIHAGTESEVMSVIGQKTYQHAAGVYASGSGESGSELLARRSGGCMASTYIPAIASKKQTAILHAAGPNGGVARGDSVAAVWPALEVIRDPYSKASQGVVLTWVSLWDAVVSFRSAAYKQIDIQIKA